MTRSSLVVVVALSLLLDGCAHCPPAAPQTTAPGEQPMPAATPDTAQDEAAIAIIVRRYTWYDNWIDNYPVLHGLSTLAQLFLVGVVQGLAGLPPGIGAPHGHSGRG
jgi:hypothetical protein